MSYPLIFNDDPTNLLQISMEGSVGAGGANKRNDVFLIQSLLNAVPVAQRGATKQLKVDGAAGMLTVHAIEAFQRAQSLYVDGKIDCRKQTIKRLVPLLRSANVLPRGVAGIGVPDAKVQHALVGGRRGGTPAPSFFTWPTTPWRFMGSGTASFSIGPGGVTGGDFLIARDGSDTLRSLRFGGMSYGVSLMPVGIDVAFEHAKSWGTQIMRGLSSMNDFNNLSDFVGPIKMLSAGVGYLKGISGSLVDFQPSPFSSATGGVSGLQTMTPNGELTITVGLVVSAG